MAKMLEGEELERKARSLGINTELDDLTQPSVETTRASDAIMQHRLIEFERSVRENRLWIIALISAIASVISATTALVAIFWR